MSQMFDNYDKKYIEIPDNRSKVIYNDIYKDKIVIGADNQHSFEIPYQVSELKYFYITYKQGTEIVLNSRRILITDFIPANGDESGDTIYEYVYRYNPRIKLYVLSEEQIQEQRRNINNLNDIGLTYCILYYPVSAQDSLRFNDYNRNVEVQLRACLNPIDDDENDIIEYSDIYKIRLINSLLKEEPLEGEN